MKRDTNFDVAWRDLESLRSRARARRVTDEAAQVGACGITPGGAGSGAPVCESTDIDYLDRYFSQDVGTFRALAASTVDTITFAPKDQYFCPVAIAAVVTDNTDPTLPSRAWIFAAQIRGCDQFDFTNDTNTVAGANRWIDTSEWDPFARSGCACRINWGCYSGGGNQSAQLRVTVANPNATPIIVKLTIWGVGYTCCPGFFGSEKAMVLPRDPGQPAPVAPPAPIGRLADRAPAIR